MRLFNIKVKAKFFTVSVIFVIVLNTYTLLLMFAKEGTVSHSFIVEQYYERRKSWKLSNLGNVLYKNEDYPKLSDEKKNNTFLILIWHHWKFLKRRHLYYFTRAKQDPLKECSVHNCNFTGDSDALPLADAVISYMYHGIIPPMKQKKSNQRWIFLNDESPPHAFDYATHPIPLDVLANIFNWSMTYTSTSDIPVPYGRTVALKTPKYSSPNPPIERLIPNWKNKTGKVAILISDCTVPYRTRIITEMRKHIEVHVFGKCGEQDFKKSCPGHYKKDCKNISQYLFYLALENEKCKEYMTEKLFHNAYTKGAIPIIEGPSLEDCKTFLPPNSFLHVDNYATIKDLADDVKRISYDKEEILSYHKWRNHFEVLDEHGYFGTRSFHLCRVCEAMNYNDDAHSVYKDQRIYQFFSPTLLCRDLD